MNKKQQEKLQSEAGNLLEQGKVQYIIGFEPGTVKFATTPLVITDKKDIARLTVNHFITNNLAKQLIPLKGKAAIVAKGCDSRSIVSLIQDHKVARENIIIIGVPCEGLIDINNIQQLMGKERDEIDDITREGDKIIVTAGKDKKDFTLKDVLYAHCLSCETPTPKEYDILLGEPSSPPTDKAAGQANITDLEKMTPEQRYEFWKEQMQKCTRCYACRNVCPACYCERCFVEETEPQWIESVPNWQDNLMFQTIRNMHVAGRCTDCGNCERACPVGIPLRSLSKKMYDIVDETFHFKAGNDINEQPLMASYEQNEAEEMIR
ncbi:MAG: 4Fe-4S dicluster domain-containing protein [Dehalococcoidales bacterium]|nr:4Fe-4S dicluster domain-containing protein [Dehalococcoidales bacterium]